MVIRIKKLEKEGLDEIIILLMILQVLIIRWVSESIFNFFNIVLVTMIGIALLRYRSLMNSKCIITLLFFLSYQVLNFIVLGGRMDYFLRNWFRIFRSVVIVIYITNLIKVNSKLLSDVLERWWLGFNLYALLNIPILLQQKKHDFTLTSFESMIGKISYRNANYYSKDMMSGLFGLYGTPCLAMFITFLILFNITKTMECKQRVKKRMIQLLNLILIVFNLWMAAQNDNKGFYIILLLFAYLFVLSINENKLINSRSIKNKKEHRINGYIKAILCFFLMIIFGIIAYSSFDGFNEVVDMALLKIKEGIVFNQRRELIAVRGGGERFAMIMYALTSKRMAIVGAGLGNYVHTAGELGFAHFGQADVGTYLCLGGLVYIFLMFLIVYQCFKRNFNHPIVPKNMILTFFILSCYTHIFMDTSITISIMFAYFIIWKISQKQDVQNKKELLI